ncbi:mimivirus translation initiation factor 2 gamma subunit [Cotonvirus japonicus]|uniref:protein-synthesizing GTPase n=1 Tax=Cotonvirus japonicus TaxID=2811091 RepID=A0ABM7NTN2_9VIRU|nr:mimivirus translation initiation factor 2 gamma subunit [Cotonvirus japonicus]BCS83451.1 mimivirus translation initiation factor 2 gamma subunit [Cotonvirus japonicus]
MNNLQPAFNIGMVGNVSHGKTTTIRALTGIDTFKYSKEKEKGITMKLGYTNCKIFKCNNCMKNNRQESDCYYSTNDKITNLVCNWCKNDCVLVKYFSFVDCPGHESLMGTMLSGATVMDYALLLIDGSQPCPQPQTIEHLAALEILRVKKIIILQNKLDLVNYDDAMENYNQIKIFVKDTCAESAPIIPISAQKQYNISVLCEYIYKYFEEINRDNNTIKMNIIRSFDINKPGCQIQDIVGGVIGGSIISGKLTVGDEIEIRPGIVEKSMNKLTWRPIKTHVVCLKSDSSILNQALPGGLIGVCTHLDPSLTKSDGMIGQVVGIPGSMPDVYTTLNAKCVFMRRILLNIKVIKPKNNQHVLLSISSKSIGAVIKSIKNSIYNFELDYPCCINIGDIFSISVKIEGSWRLIGMGTLIEI